jgi:hypothetical protein
MTARHILIKPREHRVLTAAEAGGVRILSGEVWLTRHGDRDDHILRQGDSMRIEGPGGVLVGALTPALIEVEPRERRGLVARLVTALQALLPPQPGSA